MVKGDGGRSSGRGGGVSWGRSSAGAGSSSGRPASSGLPAGSASAGRPVEGSSAGKRAPNMRMWSQPATAKQVAALQARGNYDGKYYSKGRASRVIGGAVPAGGASGAKEAGQAGVQMLWADARVDAHGEECASNPFEVPRDNGPQAHVIEEKRLEMFEIGDAPARELSMSVVDGVLPFAFLVDLEHRNLRRLEEQFGVHSPDHVRREITDWSQAKIAVARAWMLGRADIVAILRQAPVGTFSDLEVAARTLLLEAFPADIEERNVRRLESQFGVHSPDHVRQQAKVWVASRVEVARANAEFLVEVAVARTTRSEPPAIGATPARRVPTEQSTLTPGPKENRATRPQNIAGAQHCGTITSVNSRGATVEIAPGIEGWLHISKLRPLAGGAHVNSVEEHLRMGQKIDVREISTGERGRLLLALARKRSPGGGPR